MKKFLLLCCLCISATSFLAAQVKDYNVVFDITSGDTVDHKAVVRQAAGIIKANPAAKVEIVIYSQALNLAVKDKSVVAEAVQDLAKSGVSFRVCAITMKRNNIETGMLVPGVGTVPDGIYEIIVKQREGYGYIKVGH
jgi:intracellular sulfur oxidation DsrE/DsrF family protein